MQVSRTLGWHRRHEVKLRSMQIAFAVVAAIGLFISDEPAGALRGQGQVFTTPQGRIENVRFEQEGGGVISIYYDLQSDTPDAVFAIAVKVSEDGGKTFNFTPKSIEGDVANVRPGGGKRIVWRSGRDVEVLQIDQLKFDVTAVSGKVVPLVAGDLTVTTTPAGATVFVDGQPRGQTPATVRGLSPGQHVIRIVREGFSENQRELLLRAGQPEQVTVTLTALPVAAPPPVTTEQVEASKGRNKLVYVLPAVGGAAVAAVLLRGGSDPVPDPTPTPTPTPVSCTGFSHSPALDAISFSPGGGPFNVSVSLTPSGCETPLAWTTSAGGLSWISFNPASGSSNATVAITAAANTGSATRSGTITVAQRNIGVIQSPVASSCTYTVRMRQGSNNADNVGGGGGARDVDITASASNCAWTSSVDVPWISVSPSSGTGSTSSGSPVVLTIERNTSGAQRVGRVTIQGTVITLTQIAS
jgi:hypothetical protein